MVPSELVDDVLQCRSVMSQSVVIVESIDVDLCKADIMVRINTCLRDGVLGD